MKKKPIDASDTPQKPAPKVEPRRLDPEPLGDPGFAERRDPSEEQDPYGMAAPECDYCQYDMEDSFSSDQQDDFDDDFDADYEELPEDEFMEYLEMGDAENLEEEKKAPAPEKSGKKTDAEHDAFDSMDADEDIYVSDDDDSEEF